MKWIKIEDQKPPVSHYYSEEGEDDREPTLLLLRFKDEWDVLHTIIGTFSEQEKYVRTTHSSEYGKQTTTIETMPHEFYFSSCCPIGKYCSERIEMNRITHWMPLPPSPEDIVKHRDPNWEDFTPPHGD